jgi:hypothetical protein
MKKIIFVVLMIGMCVSSVYAELSIQAQKDLEKKRKEQAE